MKTWNVFISHSSADNEDFVLPLAEELRARGVSVWLDRWAIDLGSSISASISEGLKSSRFGLVVLSKAFFAGVWPRKELAALFAREADGAACIVPIWHNVDYSEVLENEPLLADRMAASSADGVVSVAEHVVRLLTAQEGLGSITADELAALTKRLLPGHPVDSFWQTQLLADLDRRLYRSISDVELAFHRALPAIEAYNRQNPNAFKSGTSYLIKALGFVDLCFRSRHSWGPETRTAFAQHESLVDWGVV